MDIQKDNRYERIVTRKIKEQASFGLFYAHLSISKTRADILREQGFEVKDSHEKKYYPRLHRISWKNAKVNESNMYSLDETSDKYSFSQKMWILASKNKHVKAC